MASNNVAPIRIASESSSAVSHEEFNVNLSISSAEWQQILIDFSFTEIASSNQRKILAVLYLSLEFTSHVCHSLCLKHRRAELFYNELRFFSTSWIDRILSGLPLGSSFPYFHWLSSPTQYVRGRVKALPSYDKTHLSEYSSCQTQNEAQRIRFWSGL